MAEPRSLGLVLVATGVLLALIGLAVYHGGFSWFGRLPGDIRYQGEHTRVLIPITSMILASIVLTLLANLLRRWL
jgi:hypothetical protein